MAKQQCANCQKQLGVFSSKTKIADGVVCSDCLKAAGITDFSNAQTFNSGTLRELLQRRQALITSFSPTKKIGRYLQVDDNNRAFKIGKNLFNFSDLLSFELLEDGESVVKGGLGRAITGGLLFGGIGALVGGATGKKKTKNICKSMRLKVTLRNTYTDSVHVEFLMSEVKTQSSTYKGIRVKAEACISALENIADQNKASEAPVATQAPSSAADEILKFKQLLDQGILTPEEFELKKKELLGL